MYKLDQCSDRRRLVPVVVVLSIFSAWIAVCYVASLQLCNQASQILATLATVIMK
jgi:hypothetical protein